MTRILGPRLALIAVVLALSLLASSAAAQRIVLIRPKTADPALLQAFGRLQGELKTYDFEVIVVDAGDVEPSPRRLARAAEQAGAVASISLVRTEGLATADVWMRDRVTGKTTMRTIATSEEREASSVLAVRAVDLLRTSLREFPPGERPPSDVVGAAPERAPPHVREWAAAKTSSEPWSVEAGIVVQTTFSSLGSVFGPTILLGYAPAERLCVALGFQGPLAGAEASTGRASVSLRSEQTFAEVRYRPVVGSTWSAEATLGLGAHHLEVEGSAEPPFSGRSDSAWTGLGALGLGFELKLAGSVALLAFTRAVILAPRPVVRFAESSISYGRPSLQAGANLRVYF